MTAAARALPRWVPVAGAAALALLCDPAWLDYEAARRGLLLLVVGLAALAAPRWFAAPAAGERWLLLFLLWNVVAALANAATAIWPDVALRLLHDTALLLLLRLAVASGSRPWLRTAAMTLPIVAAIGLLQRLGVEVLGGTADEPVSLFGNRNVAAEFVAIAGAAVTVGFAQQRRLGAVALLLGGAYAVANGSRSALVALPVAALFAALAGRAQSPRDRWLPLILLLLGGIVGAAVAMAPRPAPANPGTAIGTATLEVRLEIARGGLAMLRDQPLLGHGPGQFAVQYPRYRSQREIEISSLGRAERRRVGTAHDDWLETAIDGGVPALLLLLAYAATRWRAAAGERQTLAPLLALGLLMLVRAPLGNAPAVALALLAAAPLEPVVAAEARPRAPWLRALGLLLLLTGLAVAAAQSCLGRAAAPGGAAATAANAAAIWPFDPTAWQLLAQRRRGEADDAAGTDAALQAIERAIALRPHEPSYRLQRADYLRQLGRFDDGKRELAEVARLDPGDPEVNVALAGIYFTQRDAEGAIAALCTDPPPLLRRGLAQRLDEFARLSAQAGDLAGGRRFTAEAAFVRALDATGGSDTRQQTVAAEQFATMKLAFQSAGLHERDLREYIVLALLALDLGDAAKATAAAKAAGTGERQLLAWQWSLLRERAARLREVAAWRELLPAP